MFSNCDVLNPYYSIITDGDNEILLLRTEQVILWFPYNSGYQNLLTT